MSVLDAMADLRARVWPDKYGPGEPGLHPVDALAQAKVEHRQPDPTSYWDLCNRKGGWIQTFTGHQFWPLDPRPEDVRIIDIAHALSMKCRYGGHCKFFYSVAEHSVHIGRRVGTIEALMHDAAEAYSPFGDVPTPVKASVPWVHPIEDRIEQAIADKFRLTLPWPKAVKDADRAILFDEKPALLVNGPKWDFNDIPLGITIEGWTPAVAEQMFLIEFAKLARLDR